LGTSHWCVCKTIQSDPKQTSVSCMETAPIFAVVPSTHQWVRNER